MTTWILIVMLSQGWGGKSVMFQEFSSEARCKVAQQMVVNKLTIVSNGGWAVECVAK